MTAHVFTIKGNANRSARQQGLDPATSVQKVDGGFIVVAPVAAIEVTAEQVRAETEKQICDAADQVSDEAIPEFLQRPLPEGEALVVYRSRLDKIAASVSPDRVLDWRPGAYKETKTAAAAEARAERGPTKISAVLSKAKSDTGVTLDEVKQITGWSRLGGFYAAMAKSGLKTEKVKEGKAIRFFLKQAA